MIVKCDKCGNTMEDVRATKTSEKAPDFKCQTRGCKFQRDRKTGEWIPSDYKTAKWMNDVMSDEEAEFERSLPPVEPNPSTPAPASALPTPEPPDFLKPQAKVDPEQAIWDRKDRTSIAQTSINAAATVYQGRDIEPSKLTAFAETVYAWIVGKRN